MQMIVCASVQWDKVGLVLGIANIIMEKTAAKKAEKEVVEG